MGAEVGGWGLFGSSVVASSGRPTASFRESVFRGRDDFVPVAGRDGGCCERLQIGFEQWRFPPSSQVEAAGGPSADGLHSDFQRAVEAVDRASVWR